jgi:chromosome segregation ATPase
MKRLVVLLTALALAGAALAQQARDDGGAARLQAMVQQLTAERTQLQTASTKPKTDLDTANAELKKARDANAALERRLAQAETSVTQVNAANTRSAAQIEQQRASTAELVARFRMLAETLADTELERNELRATLAARESALKQCVTNNQKLFDTGVEVLGRYEQKGCFTSMRDNEPFTQNKRVQLQNLVDEYRWALEDQKLPEKSASPTAATDGT